MITLVNLLAPMNISQMISWAVSLDPNSSWDESIETDPSITEDELRSSMLAAYDDADTEAYINK